MHDSPKSGAGRLECHLSPESLPQIGNYCHPTDAVGLGRYGKCGSRPTLEELHLGQKPNQKDWDSGGAETSTAGGFKLGWIQGVLVRCLLNIWGVMLFLRLSWVVAEAGIGQAILVILLATVVTSLTTLSMSAISTNGQIKGGGTYYMISRSLGPEFGAAIGIIFAIANAVALSLHTVGFCESLNDLLAQMGVKIIDNGPNDIRIVGSITLVVLAFIVGIGMEWEAKAQLVLMGILIVALANFIVGSFIGPTGVEDIAKGFVGYNWELMTSNFPPDYRVFDGIQQNFFSVFAVFFPAATGILAGANISGNLKNPSSAIPKGTLSAITITSFSYIVFAIIAGASVLRDATGNPEDYVNGTVQDFQALCNTSQGHYDCEWGLHNSYQVMTLVSAFDPLNYAGCFAATLSSALACFVSAPKIFQALCQDRLFPYLHVFAKGYGKNQEPLRAYALTFVIGLACVLIAELNIIAPLISNCYLASYALVNFSTFHVDLIQPIGWRPTFRYYNKWLSLLGCVLSIAAMFLCSWPTALITLGVVSALVMVVKYRKPQVNWGSSTQAQAYKTALITVHQLGRTEDHVKTYLPQILVMTGKPNMRPSLVDFGYLLCKNNSLMVCGDVVQERQDHRQRSERIANASRWLRLHKTKAFYNLVDNMNFPAGVAALLQASGIGKLRPNILLLGYPSQWKTGSSTTIDEYFAALHTAFEMHVAIAILRVQEGLDYTGVIADTDFIEDVTGEDNGAFSLEDCASTSSSTPSNAGSRSTKLVEGGTEDGSEAELASVTTSSPKAVCAVYEKPAKKTRVTFKDPAGRDLPSEVLNSIHRFRLKQKLSTIDVWWLYDDGGLSMLLPYILTTRSNWSDSVLRVFCLAGEKDDVSAKSNSMKMLLNKFRIQVRDVVVITDATQAPSAATEAWFDSMTCELVRKSGDAGTSYENGDLFIAESELVELKAKTSYHMRLRELLLQYSREANLVVMTLPVPRKGTTSAPLYTAWLETLTADMPPFLLIRGNQTSVLTFLS